ncbi:MAG: cell division protein SepF [Candidatus Micrarchaeia archaeon]|jgi:SepF-like predicted cell division protein (DUF552 family)
MGVFSGLSKALGISKEMSLDEFMTAQEAEDVDVLHKQADYYVKPISLQMESDAKLVEEELKQRNHVILNIAPMARNPQKLKSAINDIKAFVNGINGDMARLDEDKILLTPQNVKIVKRRKQ